MSSQAIISVEDDKFVVRLNTFDSDTVMKLKCVKGHRYDPSSKLWTFPLDYDTYDDLKLIVTPSLHPSAFDFLRFQQEDGYNPTEEFEVNYTPPKNQGIKIYKHQVVTFNYLMHYPHAANFSTMGTGKTMTTLWMLDYRFRNNIIQKALVITPLVVMDTAWMEDGSKFKDLRIGKVYGTRQQRIKILNSGNHDIYLINWDYTEILDACDFDFDCVILDESAKSRNHNTKRFSVLKKYLPTDYTYLLSGLPAPNTPLDYWAQFYLLDRGRTLGQSFYTFRNRYFYSAGYGGHLWKINEKNRQLIEGKIKAKSIRYTLDDCVDMPPNIESFREVELSLEHLSIYRKMEMEFFIEVYNNKITASNMMAKSQKLRQITGGYILDSNGDVHLAVSNDNNAKFKELESIIFEEFPGKKILVFSYYNAHTYHLHKHFKSKGVNCGLFYGGNSNEEHVKVIKDFQEGDLQVIFGNPTSIGTGTTLTKATTIVWFTPTWSYEDFDQARQRVHRIGLDHRTYEIFLVAKGSLEMKMYKALQEKKKVSDVVLDAVADKFRFARRS